MTIYFRYDGQANQPLKGTPMEPPISGLIAEVATQKSESTALPFISPKLCNRYVDDTFVIIKRKSTDYARVAQHHLQWYQIFKGITEEQHVVIFGCTSEHKHRRDNANMRIPEENAYRSDCKLPQQLHRQPPSELRSKPVQKSGNTAVQLIWED